jgi:hypothetical protein
VRGLLYPEFFLLTFSNHRDILTLVDNSFMDKPVRLSEHAKGRLLHRGVTKEEIVECIKKSKWIPAELNRTQCSKDFRFSSTWNKKHYETKQVNPIFAEEETEIVVMW